METAIYICIGSGVVIYGTSVLGLIRFPDVYTRLHAATKTATMGSILIVAGLIIDSVHRGDSASLIIILHSAIALMVIIFTNPVSAHAIARAAFLSGIRPAGVEINDLERDLKENKKGETK